jgi:hypothetical protein
MRNILIRHQDRKFKFLNWEFRDNSDGSLYIVFDRVGKGPGITWSSRTGNVPVEYEKDDQKFKISYHASGQVNFHKIAGSRKSIFAEPIYAITRKQILSFISIPALTSLDPADEEAEADVVCEWTANPTERVTFWIELAPPSVENPFEPRNLPLVGVSYDRWFTILVSLGPSPFPIPEGVPDQGIIKTVPDQNFVTELVTMEQAVINFHQARSGVRHEGITSFEPQEGVYRIVFAVPMRIPPQLTVEFYDNDLSFEVIRCTTYEVRFRVKGRGGYKKDWTPIKAFTLDADF